MAEKKKTETKKKTARAEAKTAAGKKPPDVTKLRHQIIPILLVLFALLLGLFIAFSDFDGGEGKTGTVGNFIGSAVKGLFSGASVIIPFFFLNAAIFWRRDVVNGARTYKTVFYIICVVLVSVILHLFSRATVLDGKLSELIDPGRLYANGNTFTGGGVIGGFFGILLAKAIGKTGALIFSFTVLLLLTVFLFGLTPQALWERFTFYLMRRRDIRMNKKEDALRQKQAASRSAQEAEARRAAEKRRENDIFNTDVPVKAEPQKKNKPVKAEPQRKAEEPVSRSNVTPGCFDTTVTEINAEEVRKAQEEAEKEEAKKNAVLSRPVSGVKLPDEGEDLRTIFDQPEADPDTINKFSRKDRGDIVSVKDGDVSAAFADEGNEAQLDIGVNRGSPVNTLKFDETKEKPKKHRQDAIRYSGTSGVTDGNSDEDVTEGGIRREKIFTPDTDYVDEDKTRSEYIFPPISLLRGGEIKIGEISDIERENALKLVETLNSFKVFTRCINISRGPTVTRYELALEPGTKVSAVTNRVDDIALSFGTKGVRIESVIAGKSAIGVEVPNKVVSTVYLRPLIENAAFAKNESKINVALGMDVAGLPVYMDVAQTPHLLVAGATGSGKSVCINTIILSILYKAKPDEVKLILIDPKKVEFNIYNGIPHLLVPVIYDAKKAAGSLQWASTEMERRYGLIEAAGQRKIDGYNETLAEHPEREYLPKIVIIIDELADLMMTAANDVETSICRIAQKARAAGIHLIVGTQRPSVDVVTGLIKANIPSRIAFTAASQIDSRTIIDNAGAEKLCGKGDMLFCYKSIINPQRVQGAFVSEEETEKVVSFLKENAREESYSDEIMEQIEHEAALCGLSKREKAAAASGDAEDASGPLDPRFREACEIAIEAGKISTSFMQRRLSLGYGRAAKIIDSMERLGIVSPLDGSKAREVLISHDQYLEMANNGAFEDYEE
ncbi:MAG: DUF87 domain-containing protein [Clostridia bacterium]|nr:DUF87 domain-containing protein [Clostridia bacterium]